MKPRHWTRDYKKKAANLQQKEQAKEIIFVTKQAFLATTNVSMNKTWYIDLGALT